MMNEEKQMIFNKYFNVSEGALKEQSRTLTLKKVTRGFESTIDQLEQTKLDLEERLEGYRIRVANGEVARVIDIGEIQLELKDLTILMHMLEVERIAFVGK